MNEKRIGIIMHGTMTELRGRCAAARRSPGHAVRLSGRGNFQ
jgi:hypothetical protein